MNCLQKIILTMPHISLTYLKMYPCLVREIKLLEVLQCEFGQVLVAVDDGPGARLQRVDHDGGGTAVAVQELHV